MSKEIIKRGATSNLLRVFLQDNTVTTGAGKTGLGISSSGLIISTIADVEATATTYTAAGSTIETVTTLGTYAAPTATKCRFRELDATNFPGVYEIQIADARYNVANSTQMIVSIQATGVAPVYVEYQLVLVDLYDTVRFGLTALPNVASGSAGAIITSGTGTAQLSTTSGNVTVGTNNDKTGYSLTQAFPTNFSTMAITAGGAVTVGTNNDKTGYSLATTPPTAAQIATQVWSETIPGSYTATQAGGKLDAGTATSIWAATTRVLTAGTNIVLAKGTGITGFNDITAQNVWDYNISGYTTAGFAGTYLKGAGSAGDPWSTAIPGSYGVGTAGYIIGNNLNATVSSRMATFTLPTNFSALAITGGGAVTAGTVSDKTGYSLSQAFPSNFSALAITVGGATTVGTINANAINAAAIATDAITSNGLAASAVSEIQSGLSTLTSGNVASAVWDAATASYTVASSFGQRVLRGSTTQAAVAVTGANHVAADIHELQPGVISDGDFATGTTYEKLGTLIEADSPSGYRYTTQALEQAPTSGGGGGAATTVRMGPFAIKADGGGADQPLDVQAGATHGVDCTLVDGTGTGVDLTGSTLTAKVYNTAGTLVATVSGTATYAAGGAMTWTIPTSVTNTAGTYTATITRTTGASDTQVFGQLRIYVREV